MTDPGETSNCAAEQPEVLERLLADYEAFSETVEASRQGQDYPEEKLTRPDPEPIRWTEAGSPYRRFNLASPGRD